MTEEKCFCPFCGMDIEELINAEITRRARQKNVAKARAAVKKKPETKAKQLAALANWRKENAEEMRKSNIHASRCRTVETFARQSETIKETNRRKALKFAELVMEAKNNGIEITHEIEKDLLKQASNFVKTQRKAERKEKKS